VAAAIDRMLQTLGAEEGPETEAGGFVTRAARRRLTGVEW
jgi:hypothetical protein